MPIFRELPLRTGESAIGEATQDIPVYEEANDRYAFRALSMRVWVSQWALTMSSSSVSHVSQFSLDHAISGLGKQRGLTVPELLRVFEGIGDIEIHPLPY